MENILEKISERGYKICKGYESGNKVNTWGCDDKYCLNYGSLCVITPKNEIKTIIGRLDTPLYIGDKTLKTSRRELIETVYHPDEEGWCVLENHYDLRTKAFIQSVYQDIDLVSAKCFEIGGSDDSVVKNDSTIEFEAYYYNGNADISLVDNDYVVQIYTQAEIDTFLCYQLSFKKKPSVEDVHIAMDIMKLPSVFLTRMHEMVDGIHWLDRPYTKGEILIEYNSLKKYLEN